MFLYKDLCGLVSVGIVRMAPFLSNKAELTEQPPLFMISYAYNRFLQSFSLFSSVHLCKSAQYCESTG